MYELTITPATTVRHTPNHTILTLVLEHVAYIDVYELLSYEQVLQMATDEGEAVEHGDDSPGTPVYYHGEQYYRRVTTRRYFR